jgi:hypothetical protein
MYFGPNPFCLSLVITKSNEPMRADRLLSRQMH